MAGESKQNEVKPRAVLREFTPREFIILSDGTRLAVAHIVYYRAEPSIGVVNICAVVNSQSSDIRHYACAGGTLEECQAAVKATMAKLDKLCGARPL
jgi:hypothetical protein